MNVKEYIKENRLVFDGAMGTYFSSIFEDPLYKCEYANITSPNTIKEIHLRYLKAGAKAIKTNTFAVTTDEEEFPYEEIISKAYEIAMQSVKEHEAFVFCDFGPVAETKEKDIFAEYKALADQFINLGGTNFIFETLNQYKDIDKIVKYISEKVEDSFIMVSFAVNSDGFTNSGELGYALYQEAIKCDYIDAVGFNCICGPHHLYEYVKTFSQIEKPLSIMPNASYPTIIGNRTHYQNNSMYFAKQLLQIENAKIIGGCCGTTPEFIKQINLNLGDFKFNLNTKNIVKSNNQIIKKSDFYEKLKTGKKPIAVELDSPVIDDVTDFMYNAKLLGDCGVDLITIADCPIAKPRTDSSLMACKIKRELGINTMPHMTCRDRNINAIKALLLGLSIEDINNVLVITGDPIPTSIRNEVKTVYEFNSRKLINYISNLNNNFFKSPFYLYGALNVNAKNFNIQLGLAKQKIEKGVMAFFTQPILNERSFENLKLAKETLNVPIVGGILPIVSHRNACFLNNEIPGIDISEEIIAMYEDKTREEATEISVSLSSEIASKIRDYVDGYYIMTPFQRADIICRIIDNINGSNQ